MMIIFFIFWVSAVKFVILSMGTFLFIKRSSSVVYGSWTNIEFSTSFDGFSFQYF